MKMEAIGFDVSAQVVTNRVKVDLDKVRSRAIGTLMRRLPTEARRDIQKDYRLKAQRIRDALSVRRIEDGVVLRGKARPINAAAFGARWNRKWAGVKVNYRRDHGGGIEKGAFIATGLSGNQLVFRRTGNKRRMQSGRYAGKVRESIRAIAGPSVATMLKKGDRPQHLADFASGVVASELARLTR